MREHEAYRDTLADILSFTGGRRILSLADVASYTGLCARTVKKRYGIGREGTTAVLLARALCG